jgi:capsular polysaccharide biosynthesis protein
MKFKLALLFFIIALSALAYFGYPIIKNRYFNNGSKIIQNETSQQKPSDENTDIQTNNNSVEGEIKSSSINLTILPSDCDNECSKFQKKEELEYCQQVCGISVNTENNTPSDCKIASGLQKDYCLKNLAIKNEDFKLCDQINDSGIKKACNNRITEDIIESQVN